MLKKLIAGSIAAVCSISIASCSMTGTQASSPTVSTSQTAKKPNVIVLMFDDMRFDTFSYRGGPVNTPNIDALAAQSTRFDNAMTTTGLCSPSRAAFFTGRWGHRTGLDDNVELFHSRVHALSMSEGGIIRRASDNGYNVGYVGKWHLGYHGPALRGAEFTYGKEHVGKQALRQWTPYGMRQDVEKFKQGFTHENGEKHQYFQTLPGTYEDTEAYSKVKNAQKFIKKAKKDGRPFFGVISFSQPHPPYRVPEPYASMYDHKTAKVPANHMAERVNKPMSQEEPYWPWHDVTHLNDEEWRKMRTFYYGAIAMIDRAIGDIIQTAKDEGVYEDLHIVVVGDQGSMLGEHNLYDKGPYAYDELMRIPLLVRNPDIAPRVVERQVSLIDVTPTLADWMSLPNDGAVDGRNLTDLMEKGDVADAGKVDKHLYAYEWYNGSWHGIRAIRTPDFKFVWYPGDSRDELYDLKNDPVELNNLAKDPKYKAKLKELVIMMEQELVRVDDPTIERFRHQMQNILPH
ncbi:sulfatase [Saccharobesus litoralis]|uniref:Sulfatase n=1 Tax=Saccharobesus litoralis TaxID=2172099 RepID=A0A2S0VLY8_9ALTE|nr:sulfatase-like hydrolase/transferase [Saccharobesus litoralis]AWB65223.1 sulfatase [Saccharobesus litoralis]